MNKNYQLEISEGRPPLIQLIMAAFAFSLMVFFLILFFWGYNLLRPEYSYERFQIGSLYTAIIMAGVGVILAKNNSIVLDRKSSRIMKRWQLGPLSFGKWALLSPVDYISVFKAHKTYSINFDTRAPIRYEVNLWLKKGGRKRVYFSHEAEVALQMGMEIAGFLKVDLWNATDPHNKIKIKAADL